MKKSLKKKTVQKESQSSQIKKKINKDIWPQEREFLERPERYAYVRKLIKPEGCVFCNAQKLGPGFESLILSQSENVLVILNKYPYNSGHVLVLPCQHEGDCLKLSDKVTTEISLTIKNTMTILNKVYKPGGMNVGMNHGVVAGAGIPEHLHWHVIPRWIGDSNFFPLIAETKVLPETLEQTYEKLKGQF